MSAIDPTVFVIEDDIALAKAMQWLLKTVGLNSEIFHNAQDFLDVYDPNRHGCIIIDIRMRGMSGLELQERLNQRNNPIPIIIITGHGDIPMAVRAMRAGALNFITKPFNDQVLLDEIQNAISLSTKKIDDPNLSVCMECFKQLSAREEEIMKLIVSGLTNKQIAYKLNIAISTSELHRSNLMKKMQANSLAQLIKIYLLLESHAYLNTTK